MRLLRNLTRQLAYFANWHRFCDHAQDHAGSSWSEWKWRGSTPLRQYRTCRRCGSESRRHWLDIQA